MQTRNLATLKAGDYTAIIELCDSLILVVRAYKNIKDKITQCDDIVYALQLASDHIAQGIREQLHEQV